MEKISRVEKYAHLREDIAKMSLENEEDQKVSQVRDKLSKRVATSNNDNINPDISYKELLDGSKSNIGESSLTPFDKIKRKRLIMTIVIASLSVIAIVVLVLVGIKVFGGFN